jgi:hypothetical protein
LFDSPLERFRGFAGDCLQVRLASVEPRDGAVAAGSEILRNCNPAD